MTELLKSILHTSNERVKNPLIGSYICSFIIYNWRPISIYFFSNLKIEDKIKIIDSQYCLTSSLLWPLAIAFVYVLILPYLNLIIESILNKANVSKAERAKSIKINLLNQRITEAQLERKIADERAGTSEMENLKQRIDSLQDENVLKTQEIVDIRNRHNSEYNGLSARFDELFDEKEKLEIQYHQLSSSTDRTRNVYELLINQKITADRDIKIFLRNNLSNHELIDLRKIASEAEGRYVNLPFNYEIIALLIKAKVIQIDDKNGYYITETGKKFIQEID